MKIWIVSYWNENDKEPTVTAFKNKKAANNCADYFKRLGHSTCVDKCKLYSSFLTLDDLENIDKQIKTLSLSLFTQPDTIKTML